MRHKAVMVGEVLDFPIFTRLFEQHGNPRGMNVFHVKQPTTQTESMDSDKTPAPTT